MSQVRIWSLVGLTVMAQGAIQPAFSQSARDGLAGATVYICQFGDTVQAYPFKVGAGGQLEGLGPLEGWNTVAQEGGLVATDAGQVLIIGAGPDSLLQDGQLVQGECTDASGDLAQMLENDGLDTPRDKKKADPSNDVATELALPEEDLGAPVIQLAISDDFLAGMLAIFDPVAWDTVKVAAIVDVLSLDKSSKIALKAALRSADNDPTRIRAVARQNPRANSAEFTNAAELRARLQNVKADLEEKTQALDEQRQRVQKLSAQLTGAEARAVDAERLQNKTAALLGAAQRGLRERELELAKVLQNLAGVKNRLDTAQEQVLAMQAALTAAAEEQQNATFQITALTEQIVDMRARLARANAKIDELRAVKN